MQFLFLHLQSKNIQAYESIFTPCNNLHLISSKTLAGSCILCQKAKRFLVQDVFLITL